MWNKLWNEKLINPSTLSVRIRTCSALLILLLGCCLSAAQTISVLPKIESDESVSEFVERWNDWVSSIPEEQKSIHAIGSVHDEIYSLLTQGPEESKLLYQLRLIRPWAVEWNLGPSVYEDHQDLFDRLNKIAQREYLGAEIPIVDDSGDKFDGVDAQMLEYQHDVGSSLRTTARYLLGHASYLAFSGELDLAFERFDTVLHLIRQSQNMMGLIGYLQSNAIKSTFEESIMELVDAIEFVQLSDDQFAKLQSYLLLMQSTHMIEACRFENRIERDRVQAKYTGTGYSEEYLKEIWDTLGNLGIVSLLDFSRYEQDPDFSQVGSIQPAPPDDIFKLISELLSALEQDLSADVATQQSTHLMNQHRASFGSQDEIARNIGAYLLSKILHMVLDNHRVSQYDSVNHIVEIAIHRHRVRHGHWPESLSTIDPQTLPIPAMDLYANKPLRYVLMNNKPRLWALGADRDDDGGRPGNSKDIQFLADQSSWFSHDEWDAMDQEIRDQLDGDVRIMWP